MKDFGKLRLAVAMGAAAFLAGCAISGEPLVGEPCTSDYDCGFAQICSAGTCQRLTGAGVKDDFSALTYCAEIKPIIDRSCLNGCHDASNASAQAFRLHHFQAEAGVPGVLATAPRIKVRVADLKTMPPAGVGTITDEERQMIGGWVTAGAAYCEGTGTGTSTSGLTAN